jgi:hypothetical protein
MGLFLKKRRAPPRRPSRGAVGPRRAQPISRRLRAVFADQTVYLMPLAGKLNPCLRHAEQYGFVLNGLDVLRQAKALFGEAPELRMLGFVFHPSRLSKASRGGPT